MTLANVKDFNLYYIEDDCFDEEVLSRILKKEQFSGAYFHFTSAMEFFEQICQCNEANKKAPHLILLDMNLPGIDGLETLQRIRNTNEMSKLPVYMLTGSNSEKDFSKCMASGCNGYIVKSSDFKDFRNKISAVIQNWTIIKDQKFL